MTYLGLDWGQSKIGIAMGSDETKIASPILTLRFRDTAEIIDHIQKLIDSENIGGIVIGQPMSLAGQPKEDQLFLAFTRTIESLGLPVYFEDERLSTKYAASLASEFRGYKKVSDDEVAAAAILQSFLDKQ